MSGRRKAFTLVELLVVVGIIAVLIAILLPALGGARKQAMAVKCMGCLREMGNAWRLYADESRGYAVPLRVGGGTHSVETRQPYEVNGILYGAPSFVAGVQTPQAAWWMSFMAKYVTKTKGQAGDATNAGAELNSKTVMWCPAWDGYRRKSANPNETGGDVLRRQTGYSI